MTTNVISMDHRPQLMAMLNNEDHLGIISWLPHGRGFMIFKKKLFEKDVMPKFFSKHSKYTSFTRKLNRWGFVRVTRGPEMGAYYNKLFQRDDATLCLQMTCNKPNGLGLSECFAVSDPMPYVSQAQQGQDFQQQQLQSVGFGMEGPHQQPNYLELHQMQLLMRHREQMLQRESLARENVHHGIGTSSGNMSLEMQRQLQMNGLAPHEVYQYHVGMEMSGIDGGRSIMKHLVPQGSLQRGLRDHQIMMARDQKLHQYGGKPMSPEEMMALQNSGRMP
jgi:hypothetical protein